MIRTDSFCGMNQRVSHITTLCNRLFVEVIGGKVGSLILKVGFEHYDRKLSSEICLPGISIFHGYKINFIEKKNNFFITLCQYFSFDVFASTGKRVSGV